MTKSATPVCLSFTRDTLTVVSTLTDQEMFHVELPLHILEAVVQSLAFGNRQFRTTERDLVVGPPISLPLLQVAIAGQAPSDQPSGPTSPVTIVGSPVEVVR